MKSKEALEQILNSPVTKGAKGSFIEIETLKEIKQDLEKIEALKVNVNVAQSLAKRYKQENDELKQALDKAIEKCMKFDKCPPITCIEITKVITDDNICKECWKKYFMKEVLENE